MEEIVNMEEAELQGVSENVQIELLTDDDGYRSIQMETFEATRLYPEDQLQCVDVYSPSIFSTTILLRKSMPDGDECAFLFNLSTSTNDSDRIESNEIAAQWLSNAVAFIPSLPLSEGAKDLVALSSKSHVAKKRKTLSVSTFYGSQDRLPKAQFSASPAWQEFYQKLKFRVSHSHLCQLEGTAPISSTFPRQREAFEFADRIVSFRKQLGKKEMEYPYVMSFESASDGRRRFLVTSFDTFWDGYLDSPPDQRHVYEIIREGVPCRLYFDLEFMKELNPNVDGDALLHRLVGIIQEEMLFQYHLPVRPEHFIQLDSSTTAKFSRHLIIHLPNEALFTNNLHVGAFVRELIHNYIGTDPDNEFMVVTDAETKDKQLFIDTGVYTRNRMFRVLGSSKYRKHAFLRLHPLNSAVAPQADLGLDKQDFINSLVCPFPNAEAVQSSDGVSRVRLLECGDHSKVVSTNRSLSDRPKTSDVKPVESEKSKFPLLDTFILRQATRGGKQGAIRSVQEFYDQDESSSDQKLPKTIVFHMKGNRWCENIGREHKSNNIMFVVDMATRVFFQKCHDPHCKSQDYRSPATSLPTSLQLPLDDNCTRAR